jgi:intracellular sulfur oxidation DsrE/DsrF family protein
MSLKRASVVGLVLVVALLGGVAFLQVRAAAWLTRPDAEAKTHKVAIQVNQNEKGVMELALNNAQNIRDFYRSKDEDVTIEIVAYGPGLHMLRQESPVKSRISVLSLETPSLTFSACGNTQANMSRAEGKPVALVSEAKVVPSGVVRLMELQSQGYAYIRP